MYPLSFGQVNVTQGKALRECNFASVALLLVIIDIIVIKNPHNNDKPLYPSA